MRVVYSDESGTGGANDGPLSAVTAIVLNLDAQWVPLEKQMREIVAAAPQNLLRRGELKGRFLFRDLRNQIAGANELLQQLLALPSQHHIQIFFSAVDRAGYDRYVRSDGPPLTSEQLSSHDMAFDLCLNQVEDHIQGFFPEEQVIWIADDTGHARHLRRTLDLFRQWQETDLTQLLPNSQIPLRRPFKSNIADTIYYGPSAESLPIQLADVCCSAIVGKLRGKAEGKEYYKPLVTQLNRPPAVLFAEGGIYDISWP
jgi:hypothetical protein